MRQILTKPRFVGRARRQVGLGGAVPGVVACALTLGAPAAWGQGVEPVLVPETRETPSGPARLDGAAAEAYRQLTGEGVGLARRVDAAGRLLALEGTEPVRALVSVVQDPPSSASLRGVLQAVVAHPDKPPAALAEPMVQRVGGVEESLRRDWGAALSRFDDPRLTRRLLDIAQNLDGDAEPAARRDAIHGLGHHRSLRVARTLMGLLNGDQPEAIQDAAMRALGTLSGLEKNGDDRDAWRQWWRSAGRYSTLQWEQHLRANFAQRRAVDGVQQEQLVQRLIESQRALYRATSASDRPAVLGYMLSDAIEPIRRLGMDLAMRRLLDGQGFGDSLRGSLRDRLTDPSPVLRERAALLLRDLLDESAAAIVAQRLAQREEGVTAVLRANLKMMARLPQPEMVEPAYSLMEDANLRAEAAGALAEAASRGVLNRSQSALALRRARDLLREPAEPAPQMITLLGQVGEARDWERIGRWIESDDPGVKQAAAQAWADSDRSLRRLAERAGDPVIQPIVIAAATRRGTDPWTLRALAHNPPEQAQARQAWERALIAMSGRLDPEAVLPAAVRLKEIGGSLPLRDSMLSAAINADDAGNRRSAGDGVGGELGLEMVRLRLERGLTRLERGEAGAALRDLQSIVAAMDRLEPADRETLQRARIRAHLMNRQVDPAFTVARELLGRAERNEAPAAAATDDPVVDLFIAAAQRMSTLNHDQQAQRVVRELRLLLGPKIKPEIAQRIAVLEARIQGRSLPEAVPESESAGGEGREGGGGARLDQTMPAGGA